MRRIQKILTISFILFCTHSYIPLVAGHKFVEPFGLIDLFPIDVWKKNIILSSVEKGSRENEVLSNLCNIAQGLLLGKEKHVALADYAIKRIIALDRKVNKEEGLVNFYQILDEAQFCLSKDLRGWRPSREHCKRRINHRCLFCR